MGDMTAGLPIYAPASAARTEGPRHRSASMDFEHVVDRRTLRSSTPRLRFDIRRYHDYDSQATQLSGGRRSAMRLRPAPDRQACSRTPTA
jgi:hypothetical protein